MPRDELEAAKARGYVARIRTIKPNEEEYIHVGYLNARGRKALGRKTVNGPVRMRSR